MAKQILKIKGMHCASCAGIIENRISKLEGVNKVSVNFASEKAFIDSDNASLDQMNDVVGKLGYTLYSEHEEMDVDHSVHVMDKGTEESKLQELKSQKMKVAFSFPLAILMFGLMMWDIATKYFPTLPATPISMELLNALSMILASIVMFWVGQPFLLGVLRFIRYRVANMDTLVGIGTLCAYVYSALITLLPSLRVALGNPSNTYFDVTIVVIGFVTLGKYLEAKSKLRTGEAIEKLLGLQAKTALIWRDGKELEIPIAEVVVGDIIIVKPGGKIPVDGKIVEGRSSIDESMISGESIPVDKNIGDLVLGATINKQGSFKFQAAKIGSDTVLAQIIRMVEEAQGSKAPIQALADRVSAVFTPIVLVVATLSLIVWLGAGYSTLGLSSALSYGILSFVGVLVIACPCALGLATPTAIIVGVGKGAGQGILIKNAESLEKLSNADTIVLDKTGTITKGQPEVSDIVVLEKDIKERELLQLAASVEKKSEHPLAQAITDNAVMKNIAILPTDNFSAQEGVGVTGVVSGKNISVRKPGREDNEPRLKELQNEGKTVVVLEIDNRKAGLIAISDTLKDEAKEAITKIHKMGIKVIMLTGDNRSAAEHIAKQVGIDEVIAEVLPQEKAEKIKSLQAQGRKVIMAGDGINDAPALTQADAGIAMATGTDVAIESAGITLLHGNIGKISQAIELSRATIRTVRQNLFWAFIYNVVGIPIAAGVLYPIWGISLNPVFAGLAMAFSSVSVVGNSLRLKTKKI